MNPILITILMVVGGIALVAWLFGVSEIMRLKPHQRPRVPNLLARTFALPLLVAMDCALGAGPERLDYWLWARFVRWKLAVRRMIARLETRPKRAVTWLQRLHGYIRRLARTLALPRDVIALANASESGVHEGGRITRKTDAAIATRNLLVKVGSDANHVALAGAGEQAIGVCTDEAGAAEDLVNVQLLACADRTVLVVTNGAGAIAAGDVVVAAANGKVAKIAAGAGNYYVVGIALEAPATADGEKFEIIPIGAWKTQ